MKKLIMLATAAISVSTASAQCADPANNHAFSYSGKNYELIKEPKTWADAAACAVERGGRLVEINDAGEQNAVYNEVVLSGILSTYISVADGGGIGYIWIGATDQQSEGTWLWDGNNNNIGINFWTGEGSAGTGTGAAVSGLYNNWGKGITGVGLAAEPDNFLNIQHAAGMAVGGWPFGIAGQWNDISASNMLYYVVEYDNILPVTLRSFTATASPKTHSIKLDWSCDMNEGLDYFAVERSNDGKTFAFVNSVRPQLTQSAYSYNDADPGNEKVFYRLKMVDKDKKYDYSTVLCITPGKADNSQTNIYPNPSNGIIAVQNLSPQAGIVIYDQSGRIIQNITTTRSNEQIDLSQYPKGAYMIKITEGNNVSTKKIILE